MLWLAVLLGAATSAAAQPSVTVRNKPITDVSRCTANCFEGVLAYRTPASISRGKPRALELVYRSGRAAPYATVDLDVTELSGPPQTVFSLTVIMPDGTNATFTNGTSVLYFASRAGGPTRVAASIDVSALPTGSVNLIAVVQSWYPNAAYSGPVYAFVPVLVVNERASPLGAGVGIAGLARLKPQNGGALIYDGNGSAFAYTGTCSPSTVCAFASTAGDFSTLSTSGNGTYVRRFRNGTRHIFDASGLMDSVITRVGEVTTFAYGPGGRLQSVTDPVGVTTYLGYSVTPGGTTETLSSIALPGGRHATFLVDASNNLLHWRDADDSYFAQVSYDAQHRMTSMIDHRGQTWSYSYRGNATLDSVQAPAVTFNGTAVRPTEVYRQPNGEILYQSDVWGLGHWANPIASTLDVRASVRDPLGHTTYLTMDGWGAPIKVEEPLGRTTLLEYGDVSGTLLTRRELVGTAVQRATYDSSANPLTVMTENPFGDGRDAVTTYTWDPRWNEVTQITDPEGRVTLQAGYDSLTGNRLWQQDGRGDSTRISFAYNANKQLVRTYGPGAGDSLAYDALGNLSWHASPTGIVTRTHANAIGQVDSVFSPIDGTHSRVKTITYDLMGRVLTEKDSAPALSYSISGAAQDGTVPMTLTVTHEYEPGGKVLFTRRSLVPSTMGLLTLGWTYDALGRVRTSTDEYGNSDSATYDPAGNRVSTWTRRGKHLSATFDALNRPLTQVSESATYASDVGLDYAFAYAAHPPKFPHFAPGFTYDWVNSANATPPPLVIPADTARFSYTLAGQIETATNHDARIVRSYFPGGALRIDSLQIASADTVLPIAYSHQYALSYTYDRSGQRLSRTDNIPGSTPGCALPCAQTYHYLAATGALDSISDHGAGFAFTYDAAGRLIARRTNGNAAVETLGYDGESRVATRSVTGSGSFSNIYFETRDYDFGSRVTGANVSSDLPIGEQVVQAYSGMGALAAAQRLRGASTFTDDYVTDALGSTLTHFRAVDGARDTTQLGYQGERLVFTGQTAGTVAPMVTRIDSTGTDFDQAGNAMRTWKYPRQFSSGVWVATMPGHEWTWQAYGADDKLRVTQRSFVEPSNDLRTVFSEYRYDALGRRIQTRTRWDQYCQPDVSLNHCLSSVERVIWDGDQVLAELRSASSEAITVTDTTPNRCYSDSDPMSDECRHPGGQTSTTYRQNQLDVEVTYGPFAGVVRYTHGVGVDDPLAFWKSDISVGVVPHKSWRGVYEAATFLGASNTNINWPGRAQDAFRAPDVRLTPIEPSHWLGSVIDGATTNGSGLVYQRNRYYDPKTGRFTQEDPIGLAGGLNLYGFAGGDPVNFSDPFGLCPPEKPLCQWIRATLMAAGTDLGGVVGGGGGLLTGPGALVATPVGAVAGMAAGASLGAIAGELADRVFFSKDRPDKATGQQFDEIARRQQQVRKQGQGDKINSIEKSRQRDKQEIRDEAEQALEELRKKGP